MTEIMNIRRKIEIIEERRMRLFVNLNRLGIDRIPKNDAGVKY